MPGKFHYRNQAQRFDLYSFYSLITKCKIVELLDKDGHSPFDSDTMNDSVFDYAVQIYKDILDNGIVSYFDSDSFRHDSDGDGSNSWNGITRNVATARVYEPLRKWLYSQSDNGGIDNTDDEITPGFNRRYYSLPVSDSEGTIRHVNVYSFLKSHFDRWIRYDSFERYKLTTNILTALQQDSDINNLFADKFLKACEEDSDLSRRAVEMYSNRLQSDSDIRQEIVTTAIEALSGLTPGGDSDRARELAEVVSAVLETDSEIRNEFGDYHITSLKEDSDQQVELGSIISNIDLVALNSPIVKTRQLLPMNGDDTGNIGDSEQKWSLINLTGLETDSTKIDNARKTSLIYINDSEGIMYYSTFTSFTDDSELVISRFKATTDSKFPTLRVKDLESQGIVHVSNDSEQTEIDRLITTDRFKFNDSDGIIYRGRKLIAIDSDVFFNLLLENETWYTLDSDGVRSTILETPIKSEYSWFIGQRGDVYVIGEDPPDSDFTTIYDSELDSYFADAHGTNLNWTSRDATYGNMIDMWSNPGTNDFREANTTKPGGFTGATEIRFNINGYGYHGFLMLPTNANLEASNSYANSMPGSPAYIWTKTEPGSGGFYCYFANGAGATSGAVYIQGYWEGTGGATFTVPGVTAGYYGATYYVRFVIGRDADGAIWVQTIGDGSTNTTAVSSKYYMDSSNNLTATKSATVRKMNPDIGVQYAYGNYDGGPPEKMTDIIVRDTNTIINKANTLLTRKIVFTSDKVVDTQAELSRALGDVVTKDQIFNTWYRFSHDYNSGGSVFNYPAVSSELNGWAYNSSNDVIYTTINSVAFSGFVSSDAYDDFTFNSVVRAHYSLASPTFNDDDAVVTIIGFVTEGIFGQPGYREHTLSVIRTAGGFPMTDQGFGNVTWGLVYNYSQDDVRLLVDGTSLGSASTNITIGGNAWVNYPNGTKVFIRRKGDQITCYCSTMNDATHTLDSDTEITWDLASDSDTLKFRGPVRYGYGAHSQNGSYWSDIFFAPDEGSYLHYVNEGNISSIGGNVYQYDPDTVAWVMDSDLTVDNTAGERMLHNANTHKTFYNDPISDTTFQIMTARKFTDVFNLPPLSSSPDSDTLGRMGLRPGTFAMADGTSWDPGSLSGTTPYPVFYDGTAWRYFSLF